MKIKSPKQVNIAQWGQSPKRDLIKNGRKRNKKEIPIRAKDLIVKPPAAG